MSGRWARSPAAHTRTELGWTPARTDMLSEIGEARLREFAN
ncbi:hypothetical protein OG698_02420 [Streptomyces sp. NBC_01003]|nr:hypothetical protein OG698_02420 [Streptomyces sp. NBC_01003]